MISQIFICDIPIAIWSEKKTKPKAHISLFETKKGSDTLKKTVEILKIFILNQIIYFCTNAAILYKARKA
jgi:hypothetical protein